MIGVKVAERLNGTRSRPGGNGAAPPAEEHRPPGQPAHAASNVAAVVQPLLDVYFAGGAPVRFSFWDGSTAGPENTPGCVVVHSPTALTRMLWSPNELGMARAFVAGDIDIDGDFYGVLKVLRHNATVTAKASPRAFTSALSVAMRLGAVGPPPKRPDEEVRLSGWRHSKQRDSAAIRHHYDVGDAFYRLILGPAMTYSCARFEAGGTSLQSAQRSKHDLICRKLGLADSPGKRLLDVGCGWGSMAIHAARAFRAKVVGITLSPSQQRAARQYTLDAGVGREVEIRLQDYRDLRGETFDAISSIGMFEHVGRSHMDEYFGKLFALLVPGGRMLNHAISKPGGSKMNGFIHRYVFPDGELIDVADVVRTMERAGFEVRDVESLREHYTRTLQAWVGNLEESWDRAVELAGERRARVWRLYMTASANAFDQGAIAVHQVLGVRPTADGASLMPATRAGWG